MKKKAFKQMLPESCTGRGIKFLVENDIYHKDMRVVWEQFEEGTLISTNICTNHFLLDKVREWAVQTYINR